MNLYLVSLPFTSLFSFALGLFVFYKNPKNIVNITWGLACFCVGAWSLFFVLSLFSPSQEIANFLVRTLNAFAAYIPVLTTHFSKEVTGVNKNKKGLIYFGYFLSVAISFMAYTDLFCIAGTRVPGFRYFTYAKPLYYLFAAQFFFYALYGEYLLIRGFSKTTAEKRNQIKYIFIGLTLGYIGGFISFLPTFGIMVNLAPMHFIWLYAAIISYAILKHHLMDIEVVIKRTVFYSLFVFILSAIYVGIVFVTHYLLMEGGTHYFFRNTFDSRIWFSLPPFLGTLIFLILGFIFLFHKPQTLQKILFSVLCFQTFVWQFIWFYSFYCPETELAYIAKIAYIGITFLPFTFYHFVVSYLRKENEKKYVRFFYSIGILLIAILFSTDLFVAGNRQMSWGNFSAPGALYPLFVLTALASMIRGIYIICRALKAAQTSKENCNQLKYLLVGFIFYFFCTLDFMQVYGAPWYPIGSLFFLVSAIFISYAVLRYQLLDIRVVIKKTLFYTALTILISAVYLSLVLVFYVFFVSKRSAPSLALNFAGVLFIAMTFKPIEMILHRLLEKKFFKGTIGEISEQKALLETELERRERLKSVGILAAGMAHEIKNPITAIQTFAEFMPKKYQDAEFRAKFSKILIDETDRISGIIRDLLLFAKPGEPVIAPCDIWKILRGITDLLRGELLKHSIKLEYHFSDEVVLCLTDTSQIKQVFLNIIMNAIDAMKDKAGDRRLVISVCRIENYTEVSIEDTGIGIPEEKIPHLFDPFYTEKEGGTGLGLAITHSIIEKNHGKIEVESVVGQGTKFIILVPVHE